MFYESWNRQRFAEAGLDFEVVQHNVSISARGVLRGLHYQWPNPQGKLVSVLEGEVYDVAVDIRRGSPHFGRWAAVVLNAENRRHFWIPPGFAHGFAVTSERAVFSYLCTAHYDRAADARSAGMTRSWRSTGRWPHPNCRTRISARRFWRTCRANGCRFLRRSLERHACASSAS